MANRIDVSPIGVAYVEVLITDAARNYQTLNVLTAEEAKDLIRKLDSKLDLGMIAGEPK
jgi:hypothetical protein